jgi:hypothetical protein
LAAISDYTALQAAVLNFNWNRSTGTVDHFCRLAHTRINLGLRVPFMQKTADLTINAQRVAAPTDFAAVSRLWIDDSFDTPLTPETPERIAMLNAMYSTNRPEWFAIEGESDDLDYFSFAPNPGATTYTGKLLYTRRLDFFASGAAANRVLRDYPNLYLYGALDEAGAFSDDPRSYGQRFEALLAQINMQVRSDAVGGGAMQMLTPYTF